MADVKVNKEPSQQGRGGQQQMQQSQGGGGAMQGRGEAFPSLFSLHPRDFFSMSPFQLMRRFTEEMDRVFTGREFEGGVWAPPIEVRMQENNMIVRAELPGLGKEDVQVEATDDGLVISGERKREEEKQEGGYYKSERSYGRFYRLIPLPDGASVDQAKANFNNGVLEIMIPVAQAEQQRRQIPIEAQGGTQAAGGGSQTRTSGGGAGA